MGAFPDQIGPYRVHREIGRGAMGVVYLAEDAKLGRHVAIKSLPEPFAEDPDRLARFDREARLLASLHHSNIAGVYGLEEVDGRRFLVLEYVAGEGLNEVLRRGAVPVEDALRIACQIAEAMEAAHEQGVIHRDLKPANIRLTEQEQVKVLDFGLAKALDPEPGDFADSNIAFGAGGTPTIAGAIVGSIGYMSPEQARGRAADHRSDIWSFGCVLYEMLTGRGPFRPDDPTDPLKPILHTEPDWLALPAETPPSVQLLVRRCLTRDRKSRLHDIADARVELEDTLSGGGGSSVLTPAPAPGLGGNRTRRPGVAMWGLAVVALLVTTTFTAIWAWRSRATPPPADAGTVRFSVTLPDGWRLATNDRLMNEIAVSPDGKRIALLGERDGGTSLFVRDLDAMDAQPVPGTTDARGPFFSPDGQWLGFLTGFDTLMKVSLRGPPQTIADATFPAGSAAWLEDDTIVFTGRRGVGLFRVSAAGGPVTRIAEADADTTIRGFENVQPLPGRNAVIAGVWTRPTIEDRHVVEVNLDDGTLRRILTNAAQPFVVDGGHIVFLRDSSLLVAPFDPKRGVAIEPGIPVINGVSADNWGGSAQYAVATGGTLVYVPGQRRSTGRRLVWRDRQGAMTSISREPGAYYDDLHLSSDGVMLAALTLPRGVELWAYSLEHQTEHLINDRGDTHAPVWMHDNRHVAFRRSELDRDEVVIRRIDATDDGRALPLGPGEFVPSSWSPDDRQLLLTRQGRPPEDHDDIVLHDRSGEGVTPFITTTHDEKEARFSPDGHWVAYTADGTGRWEIYITDFPDARRARRVSLDGGYAPQWSPDGSELYFVTGHALMAVPITITGNTLDAGDPTPLFETPTFAEINDGYTVAPDGRFALIELAEWEKHPPEVRVVIGWGAELTGLR